MTDLCDFLMPVMAAFHDTAIEYPALTFNHNMLCELKLRTTPQFYTHVDYDKNKLFGNKFTVTNTVPDNFIFIWGIKTKAKDVEIIYKIKLK